MPDFAEEIRQRLAGTRLPPVREHEIVEELSQHLEEQYEHTLRDATTEEEARESVLHSLDQSNLLVELTRVERRAPADQMPLGEPGENQYV